MSQENGKLPELPAPDYFIVRSDGATLIFTSKASANGQMHELTSKGYRCSVEPVATLATFEAYAREALRAATPASAGDGVDGLTAEYKRWIDFYHAGEGDYADFLRGEFPERLMADNGHQDTIVPAPAPGKLAELIRKTEAATTRTEGEAS